MSDRTTDEQIARRRAAAKFVDPPSAVHDALDLVEHERARADALHARLAGLATRFDQGCIACSSMSGGDVIQGEISGVLHDSEAER